MTTVESEPGTRAFIARSAWLRDEGLRLDAATYAAGGLEARDRVLSGPWRCERLDRVSRVFSEARFARTFVLDPMRGVSYLNGSDMLLADLRGLLRLSIANTPQLSRLRVEQSWILMSCSGTIGRTVFVRGEMHGMAASHDVIRVVADAGHIPPGYLFAFLNSAPAQAIIRQRTYGSVVQHIEPHHIADLPVPLPEPAEQERIHRLVVGTAEARTEASRLLGETAAYFDGLAGPIAKLHDHARAAGIVRRSDLAFRLDAFHHVGWAREGRESAGTPVGDLGTVSRPGIFKRIWVESGVPFVSGIDIYQVRPSHRQRLMRAEAERADCLIQRGQILVQRSGQRYGLIGRPAYVGRRLDGWAGSEHLMRITVRDRPDAAWLFAFLHSEPGRRALVRTSYGTSIPELNPRELSEVVVPPLPAELVEKARLALELREQADADEERAIREVEAWLA